VALKQAVTIHAAAIHAAAERHRHVESVIRTIEKSPGTFTKINTTPESLKKAVGGELPIFETLTAVNTSILNGHAHQIASSTRTPMTSPLSSTSDALTRLTPSLSW
jgi:hypothetical protein